jgi:hypothetical protein
MRFATVLKVISLAAAVAATASVSVASAKKLPPGACVFHRKVVADGTWCSPQCDPNTHVCGQAVCSNGQFVAIWPCLQPFCALQKCG